MAFLRLVRPVEPRPPAPLHQAEPPVRSSAPVRRVDPAAAGSHLATGTMIPESRRTDLRQAARVGAGIGATAAGLGLGIGLAEGVPRLFGGQGPFGAAINPDAKKPAGDKGPVGDSLNLLVWGALALAAIYFLK